MIDKEYIKEIISRITKKKADGNIVPATASMQEIMIAYIPYAPVAPQLPHNGGGNIVFPCVLLAVGIACFVYTLKSATKPFNVLLACTRPLITELSYKLRQKCQLLPTTPPYPIMRLETIRSIIPISCRRYPKSV